MRKFFLLIFLVCMVNTFLSAQDCFTFFPGNEGATLVNKTYDSDNNFLNTMVYRVDKSYGYLNGSDMQVSFIITDTLNRIIDSGNIDASCTEGNFYLKMVNRSLSPEVMQSIGTHTELTGNFMDYPNTFNSNASSNGGFQTATGEYTIRDRNNKNEIVSVRIYDRKFEKNERIATPAGTFDTAKIRFKFDCTKDNITRTHKGIEWYAAGAGIVRAETYDSNNNLENYTILTTIKK